MALVANQTQRNPIGAQRQAPAPAQKPAVTAKPLTSAEPDVPEYLRSKPAVSLPSSDYVYIMPELRIAQTLSKGVKDGNYNDGDFYLAFRNAAGEWEQAPLGKQVNVIALAWLSCWTGTSGKVGDMKIRLLPANSVATCGSEFTDQGLWNLDRTERYNSTWVYTVLLADYPQYGPVFFRSKPSMLKYMKEWNRSMNALRLPIYAGVWNLESVENRKGNLSWYSLGNGADSAISFEGYVPQGFFQQYALDALTITAQEQSARLVDVSSTPQVDGVQHVSLPSNPGQSPTLAGETQYNDDIPF